MTWNIEENHMKFKYLLNLVYQVFITAIEGVEDKYSLAGRKKSIETLL